jgi:ankyrin repeat protein
VKIVSAALAVLVSVGLLAADERTPGEDLASAIDRGDILAVKALVEDGADPDTPIEYGENKVTPLMKAAGRGRRDIVRYLVSKGAKVNARNADGDTALMEAVKRGFDDIVSLLFEAGADVKARDGRGYTEFYL